MDQRRKGEIRKIYSLKDRIEGNNGEWKAGTEKMDNSMNRLSKKLLTFLPEGRI